jgi:hypothetical protein
MRALFAQIHLDIDNSPKIVIKSKKIFILITVGHTNIKTVTFIHFFNFSIVYFFLKTELILFVHSIIDLQLQ